MPRQRRMRTYASSFFPLQSAKPLWLVSPSWGRLQAEFTGCLDQFGATLVQRGWVVSPDYRALVDALATFRKEAGLSQRELARRIGKPPSFINKIELFERRVDLLEFVVIAEAMEKAPGDLLAILRTKLADDVSL